jgi:actin-related protein
MERIWRHTFYYELRIAPEEATGVFLTEVFRNPKANREKIVNIMFETFQVKNLYFALQGVMSLYAEGRITGLACDIGSDVSYSNPVYEGYNIPHAVAKMEIGGRKLTEYMQKL